MIIYKIVQFFNFENLLFFEIVQFQKFDDLKNF